MGTPLGGRRGRSPKPTRLRLIEGDRADRINQNEPVPRAGTMEPPEGLADEVLDIWTYTLAELEFMGLDAPADRDSLVCYCEAVVSHRKSSRVLAQSPPLVKGIHGNMVRNPALQIQRDAAHTVRAFAQEFGLSPSARSRIEGRKGEGEEDDNPFAGSPSW